MQFHIKYFIFDVFLNRSTTSTCLPLIWIAQMINLLYFYLFIYLFSPEQHAQLTNIVALQDFFTHVLNQVILLDVIWGRNQSQLREWGGMNLWMWGGWRCGRRCCWGWHTSGFSSDWFSFAGAHGFIPPLSASPFSKLHYNATNLPLTTNRICFHLGYIYFLNRLKS